LDLAQAESVAQVVAAKTSAAAETALAGIQGGLSSFVQSLRMECIDLLVEMEARLDFDDEMPILDTNALIGRVETMSQHLQQALATAGRGHLLQSGLQVAIVGRPNVGKSSPLNAWSQVE
jgi:tRNA modification GTPase